jgi:hypothetical protein
MRIVAFPQSAGTRRAYKRHLNRLRLEDGAQNKEFL